MLKKLILFVCMIFLVATVSAYSEGQNFTQTQIDNLNVSAIQKSDLAFQSEGVSLEGGNIQLEYSYLTIYPRTPSGYTLVREGNAVTLSLKGIADCILSFEVLTCKNRYSQIIEGELDNTFNNVKTKIEGYQLNSLTSQIAQWIQDAWEGWL